MYHLEAAGGFKGHFDFGLVAECKETTPSHQSAWMAKDVERDLKPFLVDHAGAFEIAYRVWNFGDAQPIRGQPLRLRNDRDRSPPAKYFPVRIDRQLARMPGHLLALKRVQKLVEAFAPTFHKIDGDRVTKSPDLAKRLHSQWDHEALIPEFLGKVEGYIEIVLNIFIAKRGIPAEQQHLHRAMAKRSIDLPSPAITRLERQDVREDLVALSLDFGCEPQRELVVDW